MASTYALGPAFKWYFHDAEGRPAAGGTMETFRSDDQITPKPIFSDAAGVNAYANPMLLDASGGTESPMYWEDDGLGGRYYVVVRDSQGRLITSIDEYPIVPTGGGGGVPVEYVNDVKNEIINSNFHLTNNEIFGGLRNLPNGDDRAQLPISPVPEGDTPVAPGGGSIDSLITSGDYTDGSTLDSSGVTTDTRVKTGWLFTKASGGGLTDTIEFKEAIAGAPFPTNAPNNAPRYFRYKSGNALASTELDLVYVIGDARSFADQEVQITFDCYGLAASVLTECIVEQDFGTGGAPSASVPTSTNFTFPAATWGKITFSVNVPTVAGKTIGTNLDDSLKIKWRFPQNNTIEFGITNLQVVVTGPSGAAKEDYIYENYNETAAKTLAELIHGHLPSTGDSKFSISANPKQGWVVFSDVGQTLGDGASGATWVGEATFNLYKMVYDGFSDANAPVSTGRGANARADFDANKTITFPSYVDRVISGVNTSRVTLQTKEGSFTNTLNVGQMPSHQHGYIDTVTTRVPVDAPGLIDVPNGARSVINVAPTGKLTDFNGGGLPHNIQQPTSYMYLHVKL